MVPSEPQDAGGYFLHTLLFTYTSDLMLVYVWNVMKAAFSSLVTVSLLKVPVSLIALLVSAVLIFLALKELAGNIKETLISIVVGVFFMIGAWTVIYVLSAPLLALMAYLTKTVNPGLVSSLASSMERMIESLSHPDIYDRTVCTNIRLTVLFGYAVTCAFRKAWNDVKEKRQKQPGA